MDQNYPNTQSGYYSNADKQAFSQVSNTPTSNQGKAVPNQSTPDAVTNVNPQVANMSQVSTFKGQSEWVRFNTICNKELVDKVRAIADKNHCSIRDVVELMFRRSIKAYEDKNGIITIEQKQSLEELF